MNLRITAGALCALALAAPAAVAGTPAPTRPIDKTLAAMPVYGPLLIELKDDFPDLYGQVVALVQQSTAAKSTSPALRAEAFNLMNDFLAVHAIEAAGASDADLKRLAAGQHQLLVLLQTENAQACADYGKSGLKQGASLSPADRQLLVEIEVTLLKAIKSGQALKQARPPVGQPLLIALRGAMKAAGATDDQVAAILSGDIDNQPVAAQCGVSVLLYKAIAAAPEPTAGELMSHILTSVSRGGAQ